MSKLIIIGAGGHGRVCAEIAQMNGYKDIEFLDDNPKDKQDVYGSTLDLPMFINDCDFFVALGNNSLRETFYKKIKGLGGTVATLIHPQSVVSKNASIGEGSVVMAGSVINTGAVVCKGVIINTCSSVDHDCSVQDFSHIGVGAHLAGTVEIGGLSFIGAGATIINNISIAQNVIIGAGATVVSNIEEKGTYVGVPARKIK